MSEQIERDRDYLYHCNACSKADENYPDKEIQDEDTGEYYTPRCRPLEYHEWARNDAYGLYTGLYCEECYKDPTKYTYRTDRYFDEGYAGERMEEDY